MDGNNKRQMYMRSRYFNGEEEANAGAFAVIMSTPEVIQLIPYRQRVAYRSWMSNCQLLLVQEILDYNGNLLDSTIKVLQRRMTVRRTAATSSSGSRANTATRSATATSRKSVTPAGR
jgi:hypothetical protein